MAVHDLSSLETRKLEMLLQALGFKPLGVVNPLATITDLTEMVKYNIETLRNLPAFDPAYEHFAQSYLDTTACLNYMSRHTTDNPRDLNLCVDLPKARSYTLTGLGNDDSVLKYMREVGEATHCKLLVADGQQEQIAFLRRFAWLSPQNNAEMGQVVEFLRSENIPFTFESKNLTSLLHTKEAL